MASRNGDDRRADTFESAPRRRNWKQIHHSPLFWFGFSLFLAAIAIYVWSDDLSWRPGIG